MSTRNILQWFTMLFLATTLASFFTVGSSTGSGGITGFNVPATKITSMSGIRQNMCSVHPFITLDLAFVNNFDPEVPMVNDNQIAITLLPLAVPSDNKSSNLSDMVVDSVVQVLRATPVDYDMYELLNKIELAIRSASVGLDNAYLDEMPPTVPREIGLLTKTPTDTLGEQNAEKSSTAPEVHLRSDSEGANATSIRVVLLDAPNSKSAIQCVVPGPFATMDIDSRPSDFKSLQVLKNNSPALGEVVTSNPYFSKRELLVTGIVPPSTNNTLPVLLTSDVSFKDQSPRRKQSHVDHVHVSIKTIGKRRLESITIKVFDVYATILDAFSQIDVELVQEGLVKTFNILKAVYATVLRYTIQNIKGSTSPRVMTFSLVSPLLSVGTSKYLRHRAQVKATRRQLRRAAKKAARSLARANKGLLNPDGNATRTHFPSLDFVIRGMRALAIEQYLDELNYPVVVNQPIVKTESEPELETESDDAASPTTPEPDTEPEIEIDDSSTSCTQSIDGDESASGSHSPEGLFLTSLSGRKNHRRRQRLRKALAAAAVAATGN